MSLKRSARKRQKRGESVQHARGSHGNHHRPYMIRKLLRTIFMIGLLAMIGMTIGSVLLGRAFDGGRHTSHFGWFVGSLLAVILPFIAIAIAIRGYRTFARPMFDIMAAIESVAQGNLSVRVSEERRGGFAPLARSINHMTTELERSDQQRRNLTADVAHELRTPLHIIQGNLEGILDGVYEANEEHINATLDETRALARLVDDLRTLSLAEMGELPLIMESVDVADLLEDIETSFSAQAEAAEVVLSTAVLSQAPRIQVCADAGRLDQVLSNLVVNALRHTPSGGSVTLRTWVASGRVYIEVADTGEGIADTDLAFIFDRFWRGDRSRTHKSGIGGGLGLAIARQLIEAHHGTISATSILGKGTTFLIQLPSTSEDLEQII